ncbi:MAG: hypothetical protein O7G28_10360 [Deltaproteobacteria bacterium]|nr:hypothetical protein [Deltaproteobacteria bacterium]
MLVEPLFGGIILSHIDLAGGIAASQCATRNFVTKAMRKVEFIAPVYVGDVVSPNPKKQSRHLRFWTPYDRSYRHFDLQPAIILEVSCRFAVKAALWRGLMLIRDYFTSGIISDRG